MQAKEFNNEAFLDLEYLFDTAKDISNIDPNDHLFKCLPYLLEGLGWKEGINVLMESLPVHKGSFDLIDLLNFMSNLGHKGIKQTLNINNLERRLLPCVVLLPKGEKKDGETRPIIIMKKDKGRYTYYDPALDDFSDICFKDLDVDVYFFKARRSLGDINADVIEGNIPSSPFFWFLSLLSRFKIIFLQIFAIGLFTTITGIITPLFVMNVYDKVIGSRDTYTLAFLLSGALLAISMDIILRTIRSKLLAWLGSRLHLIVNIALYKKQLMYPPLIAGRFTTSGQIGHLKTFDPVREFLAGNMAKTITEFPFIGLYLIVILLIAPPLVLVPISAIVIYLIYGIFVYNLLEVSSEKVAKLKNKKQNILMETVEKREDIRRIGDLNTWHDKFTEESGEASTHNFDNSFLLSNIENFSALISSLSGIATLAVGIFLVWDEMITVGGLVATMMIVWRVISPMQTVCLTTGKFKSLKNSVKVIHQLLSLPSEEAATETSKLRKGIASGDVQFSNVGLKFSDDLGAVVNGLSFEVKEGQFVTLAGPSGTGKTAFLKIVNGMYTPQIGSIRIGKIDIRQIEPRILRHSIAYVTNNPYMMEGRIIENIRLGNFTASYERIKQALIDSNALEEIEQLPNGLDYELNRENLSNFPFSLSYKIELARSYIKDSPLLLIDDIPPSIRNNVEFEKIWPGIEKNCKGKTVFFVTRNPQVLLASSMMFYFMGKGQVYAGPPGQLIEMLKKNNIYDL